MSEQTEQMLACFDLIARTGASSVQVRFDDEVEPTVWMAVAEFKGAHEAAGAMTPLLAAYRLAEILLDGGQCRHCKRPSGVTLDWQDSMPLAEQICWYIYDPELQKFRRSCEGDV